MAAAAATILALGLSSVAVAALISGSAGPDVIYGTDQADNISAGLGDDQVYPKLGNDTTYAGGGADFVYEKTFVSEPDPRDGGGSDTVNGGPGNDRIHDTAGGKDTLRGNDGDDSVNDTDAVGPLENDTLQGGNGADYLAADHPLFIDSQDADVLQGNGGNDRLYAADRDTGDRLDGGPGTDECTGDVGDTFVSCEAVTATQG